MRVIDIKQKIKQAFNKAAMTYDAAAFVQTQAGSKLLGKLSELNLTPKFIADIGAGTGFLTRQLVAKYPASLVAHVDLAEAMLCEGRQSPGQSNSISINADFDQLPFASESIDLIFSNFVLQWSLHARHTFDELYRVLKPNHYCLFTTLGESTFSELRNCWQLIDHHRHTNHYGTLQEIEKNLCQASFDIISIETEILTACFPTVFAMLRNLKRAGANYVIDKKTKTLLGKKVFKQLTHYYEGYRNAQNQVPLSYEVVYVIVQR